MTKRKTIKPVKGFANVRAYKIVYAFIQETRKGHLAYLGISKIRKGNGYIEVLITPLKKK